MMKLTKRLEELRIEKGVSQTQVAKDIGISKSAYNYYENGIKEPTASVLIKLADYFNVCIDYLVGRQDWY